MVTREKNWVVFRYQERGPLLNGQETLGGQWHYVQLPLRENLPENWIPKLHQQLKARWLDEHPTAVQRNGLECPDFRVEVCPPAKVPDVWIERTLDHANDQLWEAQGVLQRFNELKRAKAKALSKG